MSTTTANANALKTYAERRLNYLADKAEFDGLTMAEEVEIKTLCKACSVAEIAIEVPEIQGYDESKAGKRERAKRASK